MSVQIVLDRSGDTRFEFDASTPEGLIRAERRFWELTGKGFTAVALGKEGERGSVIHNFDPHVERTLFIPRLQGG